ARACVRRGRGPRPRRHRGRRARGRREDSRTGQGNSGRPRTRGLTMGMDMNKLMQQVGEMQEQMQKAHEELDKETVESSAGGGMVTVTATGSGEIKQIKIDPKAIDPDDPELLADMVLAAVNEAIRSARRREGAEVRGVCAVSFSKRAGPPARNPVVRRPRRRGARPSGRANERIRRTAGSGTDRAR